MLEINKAINQHYEKEISGIIKVRSRIMMDNKKRHSLNVSSNDLNVLEEENNLASIISCGSSRKTQDKKEDCIII